MAERERAKKATMISGDLQPKSHDDYLSLSLWSSIDCCRNIKRHGWITEMHVHEMFYIYSKGRSSLIKDRLDALVFIAVVMQTMRERNGSESWSLDKSVKREPPH